MKKYLMIGFAAIAFASCSNHDFETMTPEQIVKAEYDAKFIATFGQPSRTQTWGFGTSTRAFTRSNSGETYPETSTGINANANEWANNINNDNTGYGGWIVPPALTTTQKAVVEAYFKSGPEIDFQDPQLRHFFVQQVYKGVTDTHEGITDADGTTYNSDCMNLLTVGENHQHINNFNAGTCTVRDDVLDNGSDILAGNTSYHSDQIMLMVNIDDTSCFGYHETASSTHHDNKAALVSWKTIDTWAKSNYAGYDGCLDDTWDRSFMGFDLALKEGTEACATDNDGNVQYASCSDAPGSPAYAWDGTNIFPIKETIEKSDQWGNTWLEYGDYLPEYKTLIGYLTTNKNFYVADGSVTLSQTYSFGGNAITTKSYENDFKNYVVLDEVYVEGAQNNKAKVINLKRINELIADNYLPVKDKNLTEWVKVGTSDGYFTDWIVTLTEAKRQTPPDDYTPNYQGRIMAEDLTVNNDPTGKKSDWDFNDVVFDWDIHDGKAYIKLWAAGGTLPLTIGGELNAEGTEVVGGVEVHGKFGVSTNTMVNTGLAEKDAKEFVLNDGITYNNGDANAIKLYVKKNGQWIEITAEQGEPAGKFNCEVGTEWCDEYVDIRRVYPQFAAWVANEKVNWTTLEAERAVLTDEKLENNDVFPLAE